MLPSVNLSIGEIEQGAPGNNLVRGMRRRHRTEGLDS